MVLGALGGIAFHFGDLIPSFNHRLIGRSYDLVVGSAGFANEAVKSDWFASITQWHGAPFGQPLWRPAHLSQALQVVPQVLVAHVLGPVVATNLLVLAGFFGTFCATFALARYIQMPRWVAGVVAYLYSFSVFAVTRAEMHTSYVQQWVYPLLAFAVIRVIRTPSRSTSVWLGVALGVVAYVDGYFLPFGFLFVLLLLGAWVLAGAAARNIERERLRAVFRGFIGAIAVGIALVAPVVVANALGSGTAELQERASADLDSYAARRADLVNPPVGHWLFDHETTTTPDMQWAEMERVVYVGWLRVAMFVGALIAAVLTIRRIRRQPSASANDPAEDRPKAFTAAVGERFRGARAQTVLAFGALAIALVFASGPPTFHLDRLAIPNVSTVLFAVVPVFRAWGRLSSAANFAGLFVIGTAAAGLTGWLRSARGVTAVAARSALVLLVAMMVVDNQSTPLGGGNRFELRLVPTAYQELAKMPDGVGIVEPPRLWLADYREWALVHEKHTLNWIGRAKGPNLMIDQALLQPNDYHLSVLKALGADVLVYHGDSTKYAKGTGLQPIGDFDLDDAVTRDKEVLDARIGFPDPFYHDMTLYRLPTRAATAGAWCDRGFQLIELNHGHLDCLQAKKRSTLGVALLPWKSDGKAGAGSVRLTFQLGALADRSVSVKQGSKELWSGKVGLTPVDVAIVVRPGSAVEIETEEPLTTTNLGTHVGATVRDLVAERTS